MAANSDSHVGSYVYEPLDHSDGVKTRLLELQPGVEPDDIHCSLSIVSLNIPIPFDALSYAWGDPTKPNVIYVSGQKLAITANLHEALLRFREATSPRTLWIDAICIDQENIPERSQQVQIMRAIYATAKEVLVWLGEEGETGKAAFDIIERFASQPAPLKRKEDGLNFGELLQPLAPGNTPDLLPLARLLQRPWFTRVWTIQEVSVSAKARVVCGSLVTDWAPLASITEYIKDNSLIAYLGTSEYVAGVLFVPFVQRYRHVIGPINRPGLILLDLLCRAFSCFSTDPRDRVFALMGIVELNYLAASRSKPNTTSPYSSIKIDYSLTCTQVYTALARYILLEAQEMSLLSCAGTKMHGSSLGLPSWVPDWSFLDIEYVSPSLAFVTHFKATGDSKPIVSIAEDDRILKIEGCIIDDIVRITHKTRGILTAAESASSPEIQKRDARNRLELMQECDAVVRGDDVDAELPAEYWRALVCDVTESFTPAPPEYADGYDLFRFVLENFETLYDGSDSQTARMAGLIVHDPLYQSYTLAHQQWTRGRFLFATEFGGIGWAPRGTEIGDVICLLKGSSVPFVLRPVGDDFKLIGEAYFRGCMQGEVMDIEELEWRELRIL